MKHVSWKASTLMILIISCSNQAKQERTLVTDKIVVSKEPEAVATAIAKKEMFNTELFFNGKAECLEKQEIRLQVSEPLLQVLVVNGQNVTAGQVIARQDASALQRKLQRVAESLQQAEIALDDRLIDYGYRLADSNRIPPDILKMARIKSNYNAARLDYADVKRELLKTEITAPFSGKIVNLSTKAGTYGQNLQVLCSIVEDKSMQIVFPILESEYTYVKTGMSIVVTPVDYPDKKCVGKIMSINPQVDAHGMISVTGVVANGSSNLLDGMSVQVTAQSALGARLQVPLAAVVERQGRQVVFTLEDGRARWNYVEIAERNATNVVVTNGLQEGQKIIISHNATLAHNAVVTERMLK
ncbi:RND family efflux transporter MFP subunit [Chitinophaga dinghuensis]|uniref:RND family efflux transporter MFP subunit n=1 Tax=Chitinophaga dinghuensis TaxID=1539050 RepID=A0A327VZY5_9BACT|nr:efflux RND transporter periplasmic adaptor subunit [Chitinophaga dinghuensis]RAJ77352.1 RND family efflux transporter MFP subunit [Chitinophaga dinghuensis]